MTRHKFKRGSGGILVCKRCGATQKDGPSLCPLIRCSEPVSNDDKGGEFQPTWMCEHGSSVFCIHKLQEAADVLRRMSKQ